MKFITAFCVFAVVVALLFQFVVADTSFHDLQFIQITAPTKNQKIKAGDKVKIEYSMQPLVYKHTSHGYAKELNIRFYEKTDGDKNKMTVDAHCPVDADVEEFKTHEEYWTIPKDTAPGTYVFEFNEVVQLRASTWTAREKVKVEIV